MASVSLAWSLERRGVDSAASLIHCRHEDRGSLDRFINYLLNDNGPRSTRYLSERYLRSSSQLIYILAYLVVRSYLSNYLIGGQQSWLMLALVAWAS